MWANLKEDVEAIQLLFEEAEVFTTHPRLQAIIKPGPPKPAAAEARPLPTPPAIVPASGKSATQMLIMDERSLTFKKYVIILPQKPETLSDNARQMVENLITKALLLNPGDAEFFLPQKSVLNMLDLTAKGPGLYIIMGVNFMGFKGMLAPFEIIKNPGQLIINCPDAETLNNDINGKKKLWSLIQANAK